MVDAKWTPGPWWVEVDENAAQVQGYPLIVTDSYTVIGNEGMFGDMETDFHNAHLVSAAPDLYEALEIALKYIDYDGMSNADDNLIDNALAKARGELK